MTRQLNKFGIATAVRQELSPHPTASHYPPTINQITRPAGQTGHGNPDGNHIKWGLQHFELYLFILSLTRIKSLGLQNTRSNLTFISPNWANV